MEVVAKVWFFIVCAVIVFICAVFVLFIPWVPYQEYGDWYDETAHIPATGRIERQLNQRRFSSTVEYQGLGYSRQTSYEFQSDTLNGHLYTFAVGKTEIAWSHFLPELIIISFVLSLFTAVVRREKRHRKLAASQ